MEARLIVPGEMASVDVELERLKNIYNIRYMTRIYDKADIPRGCPDFVAALKKIRKDGFYRSIKNKVDNKEPVIGSEFVFFALTTDRVCDLDIQALKDVKDHPTFSIVLRILLAVREFDAAKTDNEKKECKAALRDALANRNNVYVNLEGVCLINKDLSGLKLGRMNLAKAYLVHCHLHETDFFGSNLEYANLTKATGESLENLPAAGPHFRSVTAKGIRLESFKAENVCWDHSDFTSALITQAEIGFGNFSHSMFDEANFTGSKVVFYRDVATESCSMRSVRLSNTKLLNVDFHQVDLTGSDLGSTILLWESSFLNAEKFSADITGLFQTKFRGVEDSAERDMFRCMMARSLHYQIYRADISPREKTVLYEVVKEHEMFKSDSGVVNFINSIGSYILAPARFFGYKVGNIIPLKTDEVLKPTSYTGP